MKKKKRVKYIRYSKERAVLSDVLPFESPIIFSNRYFYRFLVNNNIELNNEKIHFRNKYTGGDEVAFTEILKIVFDLKTVNLSQGYVNINVLQETKKNPFIYKIAHKDSDFRELNIIHPLNQISLVELYEKYKEQIIYYCNESQFSLRKPASIAKFVFFKDSLHQKEKGGADDFLELKGKEYENLKSFFAYKKYTNIYRFYEDYRYQRAEKKYKILYKLDISKCFDSIYSHSIVWALTNKEIVKDNIGKSKNTFGGQFDRFVQNANSGETNGIVIGPEFSRIFAEIILQQIDKQVEQRLRQSENLFHRKDYEIYRYVDDYFLFCDKEVHKDCILKVFRHELKDFKMALNDAKAKSYVKPMITEISIAKQKINLLFEKEPVFKIYELGSGKIDTADDSEEDEEDTISIFDKHKFKFYINSTRLASKFKTIVKESNVEYKDILNYTLAILNTKIENTLKKFEKKIETYSRQDVKNELNSDNVIRKKKLEKSFTNFIIGYIDFIFFLYSVSPRVNSSIKVSNILSKIITYFKGVYKIKLSNQSETRINRFKEINQDLIFKKISDDIALILERHQHDRHTQVEILYLLIVLRELGKNYRLNQNQLAKYFDCYDKESDRITIKNEKHFNYFSIVVLLFYMKDIKIYEDFRNELKTYINSYIKSIDPDKRKKNTETVLLLMDLLTCPYLDNTYKEQLLALYSVPHKSFADIINFKNHQKYWFVKWEKFDLAKELNSKNSQEVYS